LRNNQEEWYNEYDERYPWRPDLSLMKVIKEMREENGN